jgi:hypothetical protein
MEFTIRQTAEERRRAMQAITRAILPPSRATWALIAIYLLAGLACELTLGDRAAVGIIISVGAVMLAMMVVRHDARRRTRALVEDDPHAEEPYQVEITEAGLRQWCAHVDTLTRWNGITQVERTPEFYLFRRPGTACSIPRSALDESSERELEDAIRRWAPEIPLVAHGDAAAQR